METNFIDVVLVVSLTLLAVSFLIFLVFFVPVLMQLTRTLESVQSLLDLYKHYSMGISNEIVKVSEGLGSTVSKVSDKMYKVGSLFYGVVDAFKGAINDSFRSKSRR